jgi:hypothetical protein
MRARLMNGLVKSATSSAWAMTATPSAPLTLWGWTPSRCHRPHRASPGRGLSPARPGRDATLLRQPRQKGEARQGPPLSLIARLSECAYGPGQPEGSGGSGRPAWASRTKSASMASTWPSQLTSPLRWAPDCPPIGTQPAPWAVAPKRVELSQPPPPGQCCPQPDMVVFG